MDFRPRLDRGGVDFTVNQTFTGSLQPFVPGMSISVTMTGGAGPMTHAATINSSADTFSIVVPSADMTTNTDYLLTASSSAGHPDAVISFHTAP